MKIGFSHVAIAAVCLLLSDASFAYVDPGTGSLIIQWVFGMAVASIAVVNIYWHKFKLFISGKSSNVDSRQKTDPTDEAGSD